MSLLTPEEQRRAWNRFLRRKVTEGPILLGACSGSHCQGSGGSAVHMIKGLSGLFKTSGDLLPIEERKVLRMAVSGVQRRILIDRSELITFINRNIDRIRNDR